MSRYEEDSLSDVDLKDLFKRIAELYPEFNVLSRQYALRLMTILTTQWNQARIEEYLGHIVAVLSKFVQHCSTIVEMRLLLANLEKIVSFKKLMKSLVDTDCASLIQNLAKLLERLKD
jgi:hypothetical protein